MSNEYGREVDESASKKHGSQHDTFTPDQVGLDVTDAQPTYSGSLLGDSRLDGRGNSPARIAVMQHAQQTHGNRAVQRSIQRTVSVQRDGPNFSLLPPKLELPFGNGLTGGLGLGGPELDYQRGPFHAGAEYGWGGPLEANVGYGTPLLPWMMDAEPSLAAGAGGINSLMRNPFSPAPGALGAIGGMAGTLGDIAGAGEHSPYRWGVGLQGMVGPDEQRIMAGLRLDF